MIYDQFFCSSKSHDKWEHLPSLLYGIDDYIYM